MSDFKVGDRVSYSGTLHGTLEFIGSTNFSAGIWYGVSLDEPKGKNDGSVAGKSYFKCEKNHGIFVRNSQLTKIDNGVDVQDSKSKPTGLKKPMQIKSRTNLNVSSQDLKSESENVIINELKEIPTKGLEIDDTLSLTAGVSQSNLNENDIESYTLQIKDLSEKLQTLQIKRNEDKEKLREFEKMKIQIQQLEENKKHLQEKAVDYQRSYDKAKQDHAKLHEEFENYREETSALSDNIEMLTIDKEMAEEKLETLRSEIDILKGKNEELTLENEILKLEQTGGTGESSVDDAQFSMIKAQNNKLRDAVILMRDLNENQKAEYEKLTKEASKIQLELEKIVKERDRLLSELKEAQENIIELKEQVDSALGADEMVSNLTEKNLAFEEKIRTLEDSKAELEELCDMNNEINENNAGIIGEMKLEISNKDSNVQELNRVLVAKNECILDYEETIEKFRDLVKDLQVQIKDLRTQAVISNPELKGSGDLEKVPEEYKSQISESKVILNIIESELQKMDIKQCNNQISMLQRFLPEKIFKPGGDNDSIMMIMLIDKLVFKVEFLTKQIKEKFLSSDNQETETAKQSVESKINYHKLIYLLNTWYIILRHYKRTLSSCQLTTFNRFGALFSEMNPNEKSIDYLIDLLKKGHLDENSSIEPLERSINYFKTFYQVHLVNEQHDFNIKMNDFIKIMLSGSESLEYCSTWIVNFLKKHNIDHTESFDFAVRFQEFAEKLKSNSKNIRKNLANNVSIRINNEVSNSLDKCVSDLTSLVKIFSNFSIDLASMYEEDDVKSIDLSMIYKYIEKFMELRNVTSAQILSTTSEYIINITSNVSNAMEHGEYDFEGTINKTEEPILTIANNFKNELLNLESTCFKMEQKDEELRQVKLNFKMKCDELSEMSVRLNVAEKKLSTSVKEKDETVERLEQKLEQTKSALSRKERELDQTSEALQADINHLEAQREELKKQLKDTKKRNFFDNITISSSNKMMDQVDGTSTEVGSFVNEIQTLRIIIHNLHNENLKLKCVTTKKDILKIQPLSIPKKEVVLSQDTNVNLPKKNDISLSVTNAEKLTRDIYNHMSSISIVDLSKSQADNAYLKELICKNDLKSQFEKFKKSKNNMLADDILFNQIWKGSNDGSNVLTDRIGRISFISNVDKANDTAVQTSNLVVTKIQNLFSY